MYTEIGKPDQNAYIERFGRSCREEMLTIWLCRSLDGVGEVIWSQFIVSQITTRSFVISTIEKLSAIY